MGNFHCIPSTCATVVYREYLPPAVRYRYGNDDWTVIEGGDNFTIDRPPGQCDTNYEVKGRTARNGLSYCGVSWQTDPTPVIDWRIITTGKVIGLKTIAQAPRKKFGIRANGRCNTSNVVGTTKQLFAYLQWENQTSPSQGGIIYFDESFKGLFDAKQLIIIDSIRRLDGGDDNCANCEFTVTKQGQVVHSESRSECPQAEILPCRLSDQFKEIKIEKEAYLQRIEIRNQSIETIYLPPSDIPLIDTNQLDNECLNIYNTYVLAPPSLSNFVPIPGVINPYQFIAQICSASGCPPPQYDVICDCDCQSCPDNTCPVECDDHICCYDATGKAVLAIPRNEYCGAEN